MCLNFFCYSISDIKYNNNEEKYSFLLVLKFLGENRYEFYFIFIKGRLY